MTLDRRTFLGWLSAGVGAGVLAACAGRVRETRPIARVVVVGGGYGGATAAKYIRMWSPDIAVTLVERNREFVSCPMSNLVLGGSKSMADITLGYDGLPRYGVSVVHDEAVAIDPVKRELKLAGGNTLGYDRLVLAPGVAMQYDQIPGLKDAAGQQRVPHAWQAGPQTALLRRQLESMRDGGVYALVIPQAPYRCLPGPYERACQVAHYFRRAKPKSKVLILDGNEDVVSKKSLFTAAWNGRYKGMVEYRPNSELQDVDVAGSTLKLLGGDERADVLNVVPPQKADRIAEHAGVVNANNRWCDIDWLSYESKAQRDIHVLGDATLSAPVMPKSGHMANQHAKVCAAAVIALLHGQTVNEQPVVANTCYSFVDDRNAGHVATVHRYDPDRKTMVVVPGSGGLSPAVSVVEGDYAQAWARNIWSDMLA